MFSSDIEDGARSSGSAAWMQRGRCPGPAWQVKGYILEVRPKLKLKNSSPETKKGRVPPAGGET